MLLAAFLKDGWDLPEFAIGFFRGLGAVFGLVATIIYPWLERRMGVVSSSRSLIVFQAVMVVFALVVFRESPGRSMAFLGFILLSRIGLYGFSIGETQIRQQGIAASERGKVNGFASALTSIATLGLYGAGAWFSSPSDFAVLVYTSGAFVCIAAALFSAWSLSKQKTPLVETAL